MQLVHLAKFVEDLLEVLSSLSRPHDQEAFELWVLLANGEQRAPFELVAVDVVLGDLLLVLRLFQLKLASLQLERRMDVEKDLSVTVPTLFRQPDYEQFIELLSALARRVKSKQVALALHDEDQLLDFAARRDDDFSCFVQLAVQLSEHLVDKRIRRLLVVLEVLEEERQGLPLVDQHALYEPVLQVLRQVLVKLILFEEETRGTVDRVPNVRLTVRYDVLWQSRALQGVADVAQVVLSVGRAHDDQFVDREQLLVGKDLSRDEREEQDAAVDDKVHVGHLDGPGAV